MTIPERQLETWARLGAVTTSKRAHESVRAALSKFDWPDDVRYEVYLQGSYKNSTNIRGDSDVDVVVQLNSTWQQDLGALPRNHQIAYRDAYEDASYTWTDFHADVLRALREYYGFLKVTEDRKSLKVETPHLPADVVPCLQYRKYRRFTGKGNQDFVEGMTFHVPAESRWVVNYPKMHYSNGTTKSASTSDWFKPTVRLFKNARTYLVNRRALSAGLVPSYFLECLIYNLPNGEFGDDHQETFCSAVEWLGSVDLSRLVCQNRQQFLFGASPEQWNVENARRFQQAMVKLWNEWSDGASLLY